MTGLADVGVLGDLVGIHGDRPSDLREEFVALEYVGVRTEGVEQGFGKDRMLVATPEADTGSIPPDVSTTRARRLESFFR